MINTGLSENAKKIFSAAKFIDYFVHDILDYTVLKKDSKNFVKDMKIQDIKDIIKEITDILHDKIEFKNIKVKSHFIGFENCFYVKTDAKRLQQVFLNILSNAVKFTNR